MNDNNYQDEFLNNRDVSDFSTDSYGRKISKPWGWEFHFTPDGMSYMGKVLHLDEGKRNSLQAHDQKQESWLLIAGAVSVLLENADGTMQEIELTTDSGYTVDIGQKHRLVGGKGGGEVVEVSSPELGNTYRLEDDYNRDTETQSARDERNRNAE